MLIVAENEFYVIIPSVKSPQFGNLYMLCQTIAKYCIKYLRAIDAKVSLPNKEEEVMAQEQDRTDAALTYLSALIIA